MNYTIVFRDDGGPGFKDFSYLGVEADTVEDALAQGRAELKTWPSYGELWTIQDADGEQVWPE